MSDTECGGDSGGDSGGTGGCDYSGACEETTTCIDVGTIQTETDDADVCRDQLMDTHSYDGDYCYEDPYQSDNQPVYSSLSRGNTREIDRESIIIVIILALMAGVFICE